MPRRLTTPESSQPPAQHHDAAGLGPGCPEERFVDSVAQLTRLRDIGALDHSLTLSLAELLSPRLVLLYKSPSEESSGEVWVCCDRANAGDYTVRPASAAEIAAWQPRINTCIATGLSERMHDAEAGYGLAMPIRREGRVVGVLGVDGAASVDLLASVLDGFCRIYSNYVGLIREAERDKLTGLLNRGTLDRQVQRLLECCHGYSAAQPANQVWLAILDIDHFKRVNDSYGHLYGDEVILWVAQQMAVSFPSPNALFRFGGEEFVAVLLAPDQTSVHAMLEQFRQRVAEHVFSQVGVVTVSIGYVGMRLGGFATAALDLADKALYYAKNHGRNQVRSYADLVAAGQLDSELLVGSVDLF